jgi:hypothetical protein
MKSALLHVGACAALAFAASGCIATITGSDDDDDGSGDGDGGDGGGGGGGGGGGDYEEGIVQITGQASTAPCHGSPASEGVENLVDGAPETKFLGFSSSVWIRFDAGLPYVLDHYAITSANDFPERDPTSWILSGSNDGTSWTALDVRIGEVFAGRFERREFAVDTGDFYRFYQLRTENTTGGVTQVAELELHGESPFTAPADDPPAAPQNLSATAASRTEIDLSWQDGGGAALYRIEQSTDGSSFTAVAYAPAGAAGATIAGLPPGAECTFRVVAENQAGVSSPSAAASASTQAPLAGSNNSDGSVRYSEGGYTLTLHNKDAGTPAVMMERMIEEFFATYPTMAAAYNPGAATSVRLTFDPDYDGVAYASGSQIVVSSNWAIGAPEDVDVVAHEGFHVIQAYDNPDAPGWAVEGLADFTRARYGNLNSGACWSMQRYQSGQNYTDAYGVTARFLLWIETNVRASIATELDDALRAEQYSAAFWTSKTGKTVEALWADYAADTAREPVDYR